MATTILVSDIDKITRELITTVLAREGFHVTTAHDTNTVLSCFDEQVFNLLICSSALPEIPLQEFCAQIRAKQNDVKILLLVASSELVSNTAETLAENIGCDAVVPRPFRYPALSGLIKKWELSISEPKNANNETSKMSFGVPLVAVGFDIAQVAVPEPIVEKPEELLKNPEEELNLEAGAISTNNNIPIPIPLLPLSSESQITEAKPVAITPEPLSLDTTSTAEITPTQTPIARKPSPQIQDLTASTAISEETQEEHYIASDTPNETELDLDSMLTVKESTAEHAVSEPASDTVVGRPSFFTKPPTQKESPTTTSILELSNTVHASAEQGKHTSNLPPTLERVGMLQDVPLPRLLFELYVATFSGKIQLTRLGISRTIYLWDGIVVRVDSQQIDESLGRHLVAHGRITPAEYESVINTPAKTTANEVDAFLNSGIINKEELLDILHNLTEQRLANAFSWRDGSYEIESDNHFADTMILTEVDIFKGIWRGVREHYDLISLMTYFQTLHDRYVVGTVLFDVHFESFGPFLRNIDIVTLLDGHTTFATALRSDDSRALEIAQALYVLLVTDMVRATLKPGDAVSVPQKNAQPKVSNEPTDYRAITAICDEINKEYLRIKECDFFDALRVDSTADKETVDAAYENIISPFKTESLPTGLPDDVQRRAVEIISILTKARNTIRSKELRERYTATQQSRYLSEDDNAQEMQITDISTPTAYEIAAQAANAAIDIDHNAQQDREARQLAERAFADGMRLFNNNELEMAHQKLAVAIRLNDKEPSYRVALAQVMLAAKDINNNIRREAANLLQHALKIDPSHVDANFELARLLVDVGQNNPARICIMRILQRAPEHREARALLQKIIA
ncbi:MAG: response regulator [Deltaproteobacteria bacterium]|nr:response regulator [Deltaproteobacteria bacterium]